MRNIKVERTIAAAPEQVFDVLTDHARYDHFRGVKDARLVKEGEPPPNGVEALRRLKAPPLTFDEEITRYERPARMDYLIVKVNMPLQHQGGTIRFHPDGEGTRVEWTSTFRVPTPVVGGVMERILALAIARGFGRMLEDVDRLLAGS